MKRSIIVLAAVLSLAACKNQEKKDTAQPKEVVEATPESVAAVDLDVTPIVHASMVLGWNDKTIYVDPVGNASAYQDQPDADLILVTDIHRDHLSIDLITQLSKQQTKIIAPQAVADSLGGLQDKVMVLSNGQTLSEAGISIEAIPMYNLRQEALDFHTKGRGNGYVLEQDGFRAYISGDTEDIPEMLELKDIDVAFVCVNLPYTMSEKQAADAVAQFQPKKVYPYHYRGSVGLSNMAAFKLWVEKTDKTNSIEVVQLDWYPEAK